MIKVYVKTKEINNQNIITEIITDINSDIFISGLTGWVQIDEGDGDKYAHAQNAYLDDGLIDIQGRYNYKLVDTRPVELTEEEKETLFPPRPQPPSLEDKLTDTQEQISNLSANIEQFMTYILMNVPNLPQ
jgi:hypothetical protein